MNKKRKEFPKKLIGHRVVRIRETVEKDFSYKDDFVIIKEVTPNEELVVVTSSGKEKLLPIDFNDRNWKLLSRVKNIPDSPLNKWKGRKIIRTCPTKQGDNSYITSPVTLINASRHHIIVESRNAHKTILDYFYANPKEWKLAE